MVKYDNRRESIEKNGRPLREKKIFKLNVSQRVNLFGRLLSHSNPKFRYIRGSQSVWRDTPGGGSKSFIKRV